MARLLIIVPTRGRPASVARLVEWWDSTDAFDHAELRFVVDEDDPEYLAYVDAFDALDRPTPGQVSVLSQPRWMPMVPKLNDAAVRAADSYDALGFAGDDHLPRTRYWARHYLDALDDLGTGIVYSDDGRWHGALCTEWAMTSDIVRVLRRMVPADVDHLYCDDAVYQLGATLGILRYLPYVKIEHMHPSTGKAPNDAQYDRVNHPAQYRLDRGRFREWRHGTLADQVRRVRQIMGG